MVKIFSKRDALTFGWETTKRNFWFFAKVLCAVFLFFMVINMVAERFKESAPLFYFLINIGEVVIGLIVSMGLIKISLKFVDGMRGEWEDLYSQTRFFWDFLLSSILYGFIVLCGLILFIVPGVIWMVQFYFFRYFIIDKDLGAIDALRKSAHITRGARWNLLSFLGIAALINIIGILPFGIGLFFTIPTTLIASAWVYRALLANSESGLEK